MRQFSLLLAVTLLHVSTASFAASYVSDRLSAPLRGLGEPEAPIVKQVIAGAPLTIVERSGQMIKVKTEDGAVGWMDAAHISSDKPLQVLYVELSDKNNRLQEQMKALQAQPGGGKDDKMIGELRSELKSALDRLTDSERAAQTGAAQLASAQSRVAALEAENADLKRRASASPASPASTATNDPTASSRGEFFPAGTMPAPGTGKTNVSTGWLIGSIVLSLTLGLAIGALVFDFYVRQRHGGFRTY